MKALQVLIGLIALFIQLPVTIYGSWLMYKHVQATDLMWFIWWISVPLTILISIISTIASKFVEKK